jgi:hypothetical protein
MDKCSHLYDQTNEWMYRDAISKDFHKTVTNQWETGAWTAYYAPPIMLLVILQKVVGNNVTKDYFYHDASFVRLRIFRWGLIFQDSLKRNG